MTSRKRLILNCDDFGQCRAANEAIIALLEEGLASSATIMAPAPAFREAAQWARRQGDRVSIGAHLTFTSEFPGWRWGSLTGAASLQDAEGFLHPDVESFERRAEARDVKREMEAQFRAVRDAGVRITHADNHMGSLYGLATGRSHLQLTLRECSARRLPFRLFRRIWEQDEFLASIAGAEKTLGKVVLLADLLGVPLPDYLVSHPYHVEPGETYASFKAILCAKLYELPEGITETYVHPAVPDRDMERIVPSWEKRVWEFRLLQDDDFLYALRDAGIALATYRDVAREQKRSRLGALMGIGKLLG
ncbi:polysaccharide deacetylase family protein [Paenibacillus sp. B01]|uniref:polysaccharide deacetylase family protein n=1 Tax=Paenibacillus sp. B01 TaxID=2660554 RepID=UPI00129B1789|nr:polysaccharide deacetylase family protein [Paenibacillus sp. B01]QGG58287.1 ChbG/HpnK family deacetylase [Paenibacillus sp. B01]